MHKITRTYNLLFSQFIKFLLLGLLVLCAIGVSAAIISILFSRPIGDDYGAIATFNFSNNWLHEAIVSLTTTGRYSQSIVASTLYGALGNHIVTVLPLIALTWFMGIAFLYARYGIRSYTAARVFITNTVAVLFSIVLTFLVLFINDMPVTGNLPTWISFQLFFWSSGIITYTIPLLILFTVLYILFFSRLGVVIHRRLKIALFIIAILGTSLFNETQPALIVASAVGLLGLSYIKYYDKLKKYRQFFLSAIIAGIVSVVALYFSPGRSTRSQFLESIEPTSQGSLMDSVIRNLSTLTKEHYFRPREIILLVLTGLLLSLLAHLFIKKKKYFAESIKKAAPYYLLLPLFCVFSAIISIILVAIGYGNTAGIYPRTMLFTQLTYVLAIPLSVFMATSLLLVKENNLIKYLIGGFTGIIGILFLISIPNYTGKILSQVNSSVLYANAWDAQDSKLRAAKSNGLKETVYIDNPATGLGDGFSLTCTGPYAKSTMWLNVQVWEYYGRAEERICAKPAPETLK